MHLAWFRPLWVLCTLAQLLLAYDIGKDVTPGALGILLDLSLARSWPQNWPNDKGGPNNVAKRSWVFSSHLIFKEPTDRDHISDEQLTSIAIDAFKEMQLLWGPDNYDIPAKGQPTVMTALAYGNEIILSSSQRGHTSFSYGEPNWRKNKDTSHRERRPRANRVLDYLDLCEKLFMDATIDMERTGAERERHRTKGKCGEQLAAHAYYRIHQDDDADLTEEFGRVTTVQVHRPRNGQVNMGIHAIDPCNTVPPPLNPLEDPDGEKVVSKHSARLPSSPSPVVPCGFGT